MYIDKSIDRVIEDNMMTFAQYVIKNRALPDLYSGVKPIHLKILWSMYENKTFNLTKSATVTGRVMAYSPHGDCYETIVNMIQKDRHAYNLILGQGNFGLFDSNDLQYASSRYTECKLSPLALDCLEGINKNMVEMIPNYDNTRTMPKYLPVKFPLVLCMANNGMAVGMANDMPSFNLIDVCNATISELTGKNFDNLIPDFANGGYIIKDDKEINNINNIGNGKIKLRAKYTVQDNVISITEIPYHKKVFVETIVDRIIELIKNNKLKEVTGVLDQTGLNGLNIEITVKKGTNINTLMEKLYKLTPLETTFSCNMNLLLNKTPKVLGVKDIIKEWCIFRKQCVKNGLEYDINKLTSELHLLHGLKNILLDIDEAVNIIRFSDNVNCELENKFELDDKQSEYIVNIKLKNINKNYIEKQLDKIKEMDTELESLINKNNNNGIIEIIINDLEGIKRKFGKERITEVIYEEDIKGIKQSDLIEDYNCRIVYTQNYIKKHLKQSDNHKIKDDEFIIDDITTTNKSVLLVFTDKGNRYKIQVNDLNTYQPSAYGDYIYNIIDMDKDEHIINISSVTNEIGYIYCVYSNGSISKVPIKSFMSNNRKLQNCYNTNFKLLSIYYSEKDIDILLVSDEGKALIINTKDINEKSSRNVQGVVGIKLSNDLKCIGTVIDVKPDSKFRLVTQLGKEKEFMLDDIAPTNKPNEERSIFTYISGKRGNSGNFLINTRNNNYKIKELKSIQTNNQKYIDL